MNPTILTVIIAAGAFILTIFGANWLNLRNTDRLFERLDKQLAAQFGEVRAEIATLRTEMRGEFAAVRAEIATLRTETRAEFAAVRAEIAALRAVAPEYDEPFPQKDLFQPIFGNIRFLLQKSYF